MGRNSNDPPKRWVWLTELVHQHGWTTGIEVGVKDGENLFYLLEHCPELTMYGVDPWVVQPGQQETYENWDVEAMFRRVHAQSTQYGPRCRIVRDFSVEAARYLPAVDFVFIDAQHTYEALTADIAAWRGKCSFLCGHDYWDLFDGVERAVDEAFGAERVILGPNTCWGVWI